MKYIFNDPAKKDFRKKLRNNLTEPEKKIWYYIRNRQMLDFKFRRQVSVGPYVVDFLSYEARIVIEVDGDSHLENKEAEIRDVIRTNFLIEQGFKVIRFANKDVIQNIESCLDLLYKHLNTPLKGDE